MAVKDLDIRSRAALLSALLESEGWKLYAMHLEERRRAIINTITSGPGPHELAMYAGKLAELDALAKWPKAEMDVCNAQIQAQQKRKNA